MPRTDAYELTVHRIDPDTSDELSVLENGLQIRVEFIPSSDADLDVPHTPVAVTYRAGSGESMAWTAAIREHLTGMPEARTLQTMLDAMELPADAAAYMVKPGFEDGITLTYGAYTRSLKSPNAVIVWSDRGKAAGTTTTIEYCGVQRPGMLRGFEARKNGEVPLAVEWLSVDKWIFENMRAADILAYIDENHSADIEGPFRWVVQNVWADSGKTYRVMHGDPEHFTTYRQYELVSLDVLFEAIQGVASDLLRGVLRRRAPDHPADALFTASTVPGFMGTTRAHWEMFEPTYTTALGRDTTSTATGARYLCIRIAYNTAPTVSIHGFLHTPADGTKAPEDILASWKTPWDWLVDETQAAVCKVAVRTYEDTGDVRMRTHFLAIRETLEDGALELTPEDFNGDTISGSVGEASLTDATFSTPAGNSSDAEPNNVTDAASTENDRAWTCPRGFHTNPIAFPEGDRIYRADDTTHADILTQAFNCLTLYTMTDAGGLLPATWPVKLHHQVKVTDGANDYTSASTSATLPAPSIDEDWDFNAPANYAAADTALGTPYQVSVAIVQRTGGCPAIAAILMYRTFGDDENTTYTGTVPYLDCVPDELGNQIDATGFPDGSAVLPAGATFFGELPGAPFVQKLAGDLLGTQETKVTLLGIVEGV